MQTKWMRIHPPLNPKLKTDLSRISGENPLRDKLVKSVYKFIKLISETNSRMREPRTYNEVINNLIHKNNWRDAIDEELWNLDFYQTWT